MTDKIGRCFAPLSRFTLGEEVLIRMAYGEPRKAIIRKIFPRSRTLTVDILPKHGTDTTRCRIPEQDVLRGK